MARDQIPQLADQLAIKPERQIRLHPFLERAQLELLQLSDRRLRERLIGEVRQRRTPPQTQAPAQNPRRLLGLASGQRVAALLDQRAEPVEVQLARRDAQKVAVPTGQ